MEENLIVNVGLDLPDLADDHRLNSMLKAVAKKQLGDRLKLDAELPLWPASFFKLDASGLFRRLPEQQQNAIVALCSKAIVEEALLIEKCGMAFGLKMSALSEVVEERMFYNLMAAEEAMHFHQVRQFLPDHGADVQPNIFHQLLARLIATGDRNSLVFIIQVVLEGWGITHYKHLADSCQSAAFVHELREILKDESRHHGTGVIFAKERCFSDESIVFMDSVLTEFLGMVQVGAQSVLAAFLTVVPDLSRADQQQLLIDLDSEACAAEKLQTLRTLMLANNGTAIVERLDQKGVFTPLSVEECL